MLSWNDVAALLRVGRNEANSLRGQGAADVLEQQQVQWIGGRSFPLSDQILVKASGLLGFGVNQHPPVPGKLTSFYLNHLGA